MKKRMSAIFTKMTMMLRSDRDVVDARKIVYFVALFALCMAIVTNVRA